MISGVKFDGLREFLTGEPPCQRVHTIRTEYLRCLLEIFGSKGSVAFGFEGVGHCMWSKQASDELYQHRYVSDTVRISTVELFEMDHYDRVQSQPFSADMFG